ncbi:hypothetical protein [Streptomyces sp. HUAS TT20]|uniref:hypothetical protein n=1 Tax=Streptomyces sp. HUAS TT20 TaxID=3447509 RepID=UPI0021D86A7B|nr:hypothetical protein [Streptomyces sp. HUAS 15-9]UXY32410.1 hypothetical protein N8I87_41940 [Streptomyces sp. HUAS 15-9]
MSTTTTAREAGPLAGLQLAEVAPSEVPPLALYQSPWTISLAVAFAFRGAGTYVIDDIDNGGVARGKEGQQDFHAIRKEVLSKKGWTNCRPLAAFCPDGLLFANLSRANYLALDRQVPLAVLARHRATTVERLIRDSSREHGMWSLAGPDRAITAIPMRTAAAGLRAIITKHEEAVLRTLPHPQDHEPALRRLRHLMPEPTAEESLLGYFRQCLRRGLELVGSNAPVLSAARDLIPLDGGRLLPRFLQGDVETINVYNEAAALQGSKPIDADHPLPYYTVGLSDGVRADLTHEIQPAQDQVIAPKILALEGVASMALPRTTATRSTILAREHAYRGLSSGSSQVFFDTNWLESLGACRTEVHVDDIFQPLVGGQQTMPLGELVAVLLRHDEAEEADHQQTPVGQWTRWALHETLADLRTWHYPVLAYAVAGDAWLDQITLRSYTEYRPASPTRLSASGNDEEC